MSDTTSEINGELAKAEAERLKVRKQIARLNEQLRELRARDRKIGDQLQRLTVKSMVGKPVRMKYRLPAGDRWACLNDVVGVLLKVGRTRGEVDFAVHGKLSVPIDEIASPEQEQGIVLSLGSGKRSDGR